MLWEATVHYLLSSRHTPLETNWWTQWSISLLESTYFPQELVETKSVLGLLHFHWWEEHKYFSNWMIVLLEQLDVEKWSQDDRGAIHSLDPQESGITGLRDIKFWFGLNLLFKMLKVCTSTLHFNFRFNFLQISTKQKKAAHRVFSQPCSCSQPPISTGLCANVLFLECISAISHLTLAHITQLNWNCCDSSSNKRGRLQPPWAM